MSETTGTNKFNNIKNNKSEQLFDNKNLTEQQQQQQQQPQLAPPPSLPRVYMIKVLDKKEQLPDQQIIRNHNPEFNTVLIGGNNNNNNNYFKKMKSKQPNGNSNSLVIEDMDESASQMNTSRTVPLPKSLPIVNQQPLTDRPSKKLTNSQSLMNASIGSVGVTSSLVSLSNNNFFKENSVVQVNEKLLNRGIQTDQHGNGVIDHRHSHDENMVNKSGSNILLLSMSHSSSLNSSRVTSSADLNSKQNVKLK